MKVLAFDIFGDYAHFRKYYTTSSPLTFSFPPPPTIAGILGAIYGTDKETNEYLTIFGHQQCQVSLRILSGIKKARIGINLVETKSSPKSFHTQIRTELVKDPRYRIYVAHQNPKIFDALCGFVYDHKTIFTVSFGLSELLADFVYRGIFQTYPIAHDQFVELMTPASAVNIEEIEFEEGKKYFKEKMPIEMNTERIVKSYQDIVFESKGNTIKAKLKTCYQLENGDMIAFF
jgi:CRISPR-associated protein Cas5h